MESFMQKTNALEPECV